MEHDKRKHPRFKINQLVEIDLGKEATLHVEGINLSQNGFLCRSEEPCEIYNKVFCMLTLHTGQNEEIVKCGGVIVRCDKRGSHWELGISITDMDSDDKKIYKKFIASLA